MKKARTLFKIVFIFLLFIAFCSQVLANKVFKDTKLPQFKVIPPANLGINVNTTIRTSLGHGIPGKDYEPDEVVVRYWDSVSKARAANMAQSYGMQVKKTSEYINSQVLKIPAGKSVEEMVKALQKDPNVKYAEPNRRFYASFFPNDPYFNDTTWPLTGGIDSTEGIVYGVFTDPSADTISEWIFTYQPYMYLMNMEDLPSYNPISWSTGVWHYTTGKKSIKVAIIDTGVDLDHEDLRGHLLPGRDYILNNGYPQDRNGHGTHVAGIVGAIGNNRKGIIGFAPEVRMIPIRVLGADGTGTNADVAEGILGAIRLKANIINMSLGYTGATYADMSQLVWEACNKAKQAGIHMVVAAGNETINYNAVGEARWSYPAMHAGVISVGSWDYLYDTNGVPIKVSYSNYGYQVIDHAQSSTMRTTPDFEIEGDIRGTDIFAPGGSTGYYPIVSSWLYSGTLPLKPAFKYQGEMGTSMAAPHVAGLVAMLITKGVQDRKDMLYTLYKTSYNPNTFRYGDFTTDWGYGMIDPYYAISAYTSSIVLSYTGYRVDDSYGNGRSGNNDGILDPKETIDLYVTVQNNGMDQAWNLFSRLSTDDANVFITTPTSSYPNLPAGGSSENNTGFRLSLSDVNALSGYTIRFILQVDYQNYLGSQNTVYLPFDLLVSSVPDPTMDGGIYHDIDLNVFDYNTTLIDDSNQDNRITSIIPARTESDGAPSGNNQDGYLNINESVALAPVLLNKTGKIYYGTQYGLGRTYNSTVSGIYGHLQIYSDVPEPGIMRNPSDNLQAYITDTAVLSADSAPPIGGYVGPVSTTEFDYNFSVGPSREPPAPPAGKVKIMNHNPDLAYGQAIMEFDLHSPADNTSVWLDRFPICYSHETAISLDHLEIIDSNGDNLIEPGETFRVKAYIRNASNLDVLTDPPITATLSVDPAFGADPYVTIAVDQVSYRNSSLTAKKTVGPIESGFELTLSPSTPNNHNLHLLLTINAQLDASTLDTTKNDFIPDDVVWNCPFVIEAGKLSLYDGPNSSYALSYNDTTSDLARSAIGNKNGQVNPGEEIGMSLSLWNRYYDQKIGGVSIDLQCLDSEIELLNNSYYVGDIGSRRLKRLENAFWFVVPITYSKPSIGFIMTITDDMTNQYIETLSVPVYKSYPPQVPGFPFNTGNPIRSSPTLIDLNKDGKTEIIVGNESGKISCVPLGISATAVSALWQTSIGGGAIRNPLAIGDIDGDSNYEIIAVPEDYRIYALQNNGDFYFNSNGLLVDKISTNVHFITPAVLADINNDNAKEILVGSVFYTGSDQKGILWAFDSVGNQVGFFGTESTMLNGPISVAPAIGDIQGDGSIEIFVVTQTGEVAGYRPDGTRFFYQTLSGAPPINSPAVLGDIEGMGQLDIIVKATDGNVYAWRPDASMVPGFPINTGGSRITPLILADMNQDGRPDVIASGTDSLHVIAIIAGSAQDISQISIPGSYISSQPAVYDIDRTPEAELSFTVSNGNMYVLNSAANQIYSTANFQLQDSSPALGRLTNPNGTRIGGDNSNNATVVTGRTGQIYAFIHVFDSDPNQDHWTQFRHDPAHTGTYSQPSETFASAMYWFANNLPFEGSFKHRFDVDWYSFNGIANHLYRIYVETPSGSIASPEIALFDYNGNTLVGVTSPVIEQRVATSDCYYVRVSNKLNTYGDKATYSLKIMDVTAMTPVPEELWKEMTE